MHGTALTNSNPIYCNQFLGCPRMLRADNETESSLVAFIQLISRHYLSDNLAGGKSFMYGRSVNNQVHLYH